MWRFWRKNEQPHWLEQYEQGQRDFDGIDVSAQSLAGIELKNVKMRNANLSGADLSNSKIVESDLSKSNFSKTKLIGAQLDRTSFRGSKFVSTSLRGATMFKCELDNSFIGGADLSECKLGNASFKDSVMVGCDFSDTSVAMCHFEGCTTATRRHVQSSEQELARFDQRELEATLLNRFNDDTIKQTLELYSERQRKLDAWTQADKSGVGILEMYASIDSLREFFGLTALRKEAVADIIRQLQKSSNFKKVFISYAGADQGIAAALYDRLTRRGLEVWFAPREMQGGAEILAQLTKVIDDVDVLLLVLSEHSIRSEWVQKEIAAALAHERTRGGTVVFPIRVVPYEAMAGWRSIDDATGLDLAEEIRRRYIPDFGGWVDAAVFGEAVENLVRDIGDVEQPAKTSRSPPAVEPAAMPSDSFQKAEQALAMLDKMVAEGDPVADLVIGQLRRDHVGGWCTTQKIKGRDGDILLTCKMCGWSDEMWPGLTPARCCGACGLDKDTGRARQWFEMVSPASEFWTGYGDKADTPVEVKCRTCAKPVTYSFRDGPPLACPKCG